MSSLSPFQFFYFKGSFIPCKFNMSLSVMVFYVSLFFIYKFLSKFSLTYLSFSLNYKYFFCVLLLFYWSMLLLLISKSLLMTMLGWEGLGFTSFFLVIFYYNWNSINGAYLTLMSNRIGDAMMMLMFFLDKSNVMYYFFFFIMASTKSALFPFSSWLPAAMAAPTPVSALVHSSTLVTAGLVIYLKYSLFMLQIFTNQMLSYLGVITMLLGSLSGLTTMDVKKLIAFSTLSQLGFMFFMFYTLNPLMVLCYLLTHAFMKSTMFLLAGLSIMSSMSQSSAKSLLPGYFHLSACIIVVLNFISSFLSVIFFTKEAIFVLSFSLNLSLMCIVFVFSTTTLLYMIRFLFFYIKMKPSILSLEIAHKNFYLKIFTMLIIFSKKIFLNFSFTSSLTKSFAAFMMCFYLSTYFISSFTFIRFYALNLYFINMKLSLTFLFMKAKDHTMMNAFYTMGLKEMKTSLNTKYLCVALLLL